MRMPHAGVILFPLQPDRMAYRFRYLSNQAMIAAALVADCDGRAAMPPWLGFDKERSLGRSPKFTKVHTKRLLRGSPGILADNRQGRARDRAGGSTEPDDRKSLPDDSDARMVARVRSCRTGFSRGFLQMRFARWGSGTDSREGAKRRREARRKKGARAEVFQAWRAWSFFRRLPGLDPGSRFPSIECNATVIPVTAIPCHVTPVSTDLSKGFY